MPSSRQELEIIRGESAKFRFTVRDETETIVNLTGAIAYFRVKVAIDSGSAAIQKASTTVTEIAILTQSGATLGQYDVLIVPGDSSGLTPGKYVYDSWVVTSAGQNFAVVEPSVFRIERGVTELAAAPPPPLVPPTYNYQTFANDSTIDQQIYIDGINGNDANDGTTAATALKSEVGLARKFPLLALSGAKFTVNWAATGGFGSSATAAYTYTVSDLFLQGGWATTNLIRHKGANHIPFTPATGPSTAALDAGTPATVVGNRTRLNFTTAAPGWTTDNLSAQFLRLTRGGVSVTFDRLPISTNTSNQLFVNHPGLAALILATDTVTIVTPSVRMVGPAADLSFLSVVGRGAFFPIADPTPTFENIGFDSVAFFDGAGFSFRSCQFSAPAFRGRDFAFANCAVKGSNTLVPFDGSTIGPYTPAAEVGQIDATILVEWVMRNAQLGLVNTGDNASPGVASYVGYRDISIYGGFGDAVFVNGYSNFWMVPGATLQGDGNGGYGINSVHGGEARINGGAGTTVTGTLGDLKIEGVAAKSYGTGVGQFEEVAGLNGNLVSPTISASRITKAT